MDRQEIIKSFREARIEGEKKSSSGEITWNQYAYTMAGYELQLQEMGVNL